jgi:hypothetical protein
MCFSTIVLYVYPVGLLFVVATSTAHPTCIDYITRLKRCLGGVVVSVLATGPKGRGFEPGKGVGFLRAIKIRSTPSFGW